MTRWFSGTYTALVTPFHHDGTLDFPALERLVHRQLMAGVDGLVVLGTTGESPTIRGVEPRQILDAVCDQVNGRISVIAGVGTNDSEATIRQAEQAQAAGVSGLLVGSPYYNKPTQPGLAAHFEAVAAAVALPQIVYNIPGRSGVNIEPETLLRLSGTPNIVGVKEANPNLRHIMSVASTMPSDFAVLSGNDDVIFPMMALGACGVVSVLSNLVPERVRALVDAALVGRWDTARVLHNVLLPLMRGCFLETNPIPIKTALAWQGLIEPVFRPPLCTMQKAPAEEWRRRLTADGFTVAGAERAA